MCVCVTDGRTKKYLFLNAGVYTLYTELKPSESLPSIRFQLKTKQEYQLKAKHFLPPVVSEYLFLTHKYATLISRQAELLPPDNVPVNSNCYTQGFRVVSYVIAWGHRRLALIQISFYTWNCLVDHFYIALLSALEQTHCARL